MTLTTAKRFTLEEYHRLADLGFFHEDDRVELIRGEIILMADWIFNLVENHLEAYSEPYQELQGRFGYSVKRIILSNRAIALPCFPD